MYSPILPTFCSCSEKKCLVGFHKLCLVAHWYQLSKSRFKDSCIWFYIIFLIVASLIIHNLQNINAGNSAIWRNMIVGISKDLSFCLVCRKETRADASQSVKTRLTDNSLFNSMLNFLFANSSQNPLTLRTLSALLCQKFLSSAVQPLTLFILFFWSS